MELENRIKGLEEIVRELQQRLDRLEMNKRQKYKKQPSNSLWNPNEDW